MLTYQGHKSDEISNPKFFYLVENIDKSNQRKYLLDWFTIHDRPVLSEIPKEVLGMDYIVVDGKPVELKYLADISCVHVPKDPNEKHEIFEKAPGSNNYFVYGAMTNENLNGKVLLVKLSDDASLPVYTYLDQFYLEDGMISNYTEREKIKTDVGKFILNYLLLAQPFGNLIPYHNKIFKASALDDRVAQLILQKKITRSMFNKYMTNGFCIGGDGSLGTIAWTEKGLTSDPSIKKKRDELLAKYKDNLDDPLVTAAIEKELVTLDKEYIKGDPSESYYIALGDKAYVDRRKKMFATIGLMPEFAKVAGKYEFIKDSLEEGWNLNDIDILANEVRRGAYSRAKETAKGGEQTKFILRIFQETKVVEEDCHTKHGLKVLFTEDNCKKFINRWTVANELITEENCKNFIGSEVLIRSPMYCASKGGFCFKCIGELFRQLGMENFGVNALKITGSLMYEAMKAMHVSTVRTTKIEDISKFIVIHEK